MGHMVCHCGEYIDSHSPDILRECLIMANARLNHPSTVPTPSLLPIDLQPDGLTSLIESLSSFLQSIGCTGVEVIDSYDSDPTQQYIGFTLPTNIDVSVSIGYTEGQFPTSRDDDPPIC